MEYPDKSRQTNWGMFGYESTMMHLAVMNDDPEGFMRFAKDCGLGSRTLYEDSLISYAAKHGALKCLNALFAIGEVDPKKTQDEWHELCNEAPYGPKVKRFSGADNTLVAYADK